MDHGRTRTLGAALVASLVACSGGSSSGGSSPLVSGGGTGPDAAADIEGGGGGGGTSSGASNGSSSSGTSSGGTGGGVTPNSGLHAVMGSGGVAGHLEDGSGKTVALHGVDESGSENFCLTWGPPPIVLSPSSGPSPLDQASLTAMKSWGINAVRIPLNEDCWLGINGVDSSVGGANYQSPIQQAVNLITQTNSMYAILDLHMSAPGTTVAKAQGQMPDADHSVTFWKQVAAAYASNGSVVFDLLNEPVLMSGTMDQQFQCLKNGSTAPSSGDCPMVNFAVAGMEELVNTVRQAGANNLIMIGGMGYASVLGLWPQYVPTDTLTPPNIAASWHVYDDQGGCTTDTASTLGTLCNTSGGLGAGAVMTAGYPIVIGETGYYYCSGSTGQTWWPIFLSWADTQGLSYVAWSWSNGNNPQLLSSIPSYTPSADGQVYKTFLGCIGGKTVTPATSCMSQPKTGCE